MSASSSTRRVSAQASSSTPTETSPLLGNATGARKASLHHGRGPILRDDDDDDDDDDDGLLSASAKKRTITVSKVCCWFLLALLAVLVLVLAVVHVWIGHLVCQTDSALEMAQRGFVWDGPFDVRLDKQGAKVDLAVGFDVRKALNWSASSKRQRLEHKIAARIISRTPEAYVEAPLLLLRSGGDSAILLETATQLDVPLFFDSPRLSNITLDLPLLQVRPELRDWAEKVWKKRKWHVELQANDLFVQPLGTGFLGWLARRVGTTSIRSVLVEQAGRVPDLPQPDDLVKLRQIKLNSTDQAMSIYADAWVDNPLRLLPSSIPHDFAYSLPYHLSVAVSVPTRKDGYVPVARVLSDLIHFDAHAKRSIVSAVGALVHPPVNVSIGKTVSSFVRRYLDGKNNTVQLRVGRSGDLPESIDALLYNMTADVTFPGAQKGVELFRDLKIRDMRIRLPSMSTAEDEDEDEEADLLCSGTLSAQLTLPEAFSTLHPSLNVTELSPDVYIYDGELPPHNGGPYPPSVPPANAFARLSPSAVAARTSHARPNETLIEATFHDAPLRLIPGREGAFRRYVAKVIFAGSNGVKTSIRGVSDANVRIRGWSSFDLERLDVMGSFFVKRDGVDSALANASDGKE